MGARLVLSSGQPVAPPPSPDGAPLPPRDGGPEMFDAIARRYDLLNRLLSMGMDGGWRKRAIRVLDPRPGQVILDLCTGTGDFGLAALAVDGVRVIGLDPAREMVRIGWHKARRRGVEARFAFGLGDAEALPLAGASVDGAVIAFGIRNVFDRGRALTELARVIRPGGRLVILEFGLPENIILREAYLSYFRGVLPLVGWLVSGHRQAYAYLPDSVVRFPSPEEFTALCLRCGFSQSTVEPLSLGIVNLYCSVR